MALTYDYTNIVNETELHGTVNEVDNMETEHRKEYVKTTYLCFALMAAKVGRITEDNWSEVFARVEIAQKLFGSFIYIDSEKYNYTPADIKRRIGYSTNVSTETFAKFMKGINELLKRDAVNSINNK